MLIANEPIRSREAILRYALTRTGQPRYAVTQSIRILLATRFGPIFDAVLVDAPCSGQTMVLSGKRGENAYDPRQIEHSAQRQRRILAAGCAIVETRGPACLFHLHLFRRENEDQIAELTISFPTPGRHWRYLDWLVGDRRLLQAAIDFGLIATRPQEPLRPASSSIVSSTHGPLILLAGLAFASTFSRQREVGNQVAGTEVWDSLGHLQGLQLVSDSRGGIQRRRPGGQSFLEPPADVQRVAEVGKHPGESTQAGACLGMLEPKWFVPHQKAALTADEASFF